MTATDCPRRRISGCTVVDDARIVELLTEVEMDEVAMDERHVDKEDGFMMQTKKASVPKIGMSFDNVESAEKFYKSYAHGIGFDVRIGQQILDDNVVIEWKRYLCARQGYKQKKDIVPVDPSKKKVKHTRESRCGCEAYIYVKHNNEGKYQIAALHENHNHDLVTPSKLHLLRSNRFVSEKEKQRCSIATKQV
ncbi:hypothetical protein BS78_04G272900 [Paspalum vaginatum]|nr:hypothetical protein BS78_04G272900 [Paspalum vaginatum]